MIDKKSLATLALAFTFVALVPAVAFAAQAGGGMPYSAALTTLRTSYSGEIAGILIIAGIIGGLAYWMFGGEMGQVMSTLCKLVICACIIGGSIQFLTTIGVTGAIV